ncbi:MAG: HNH endonuclease [Candidatus Methanogranum gryphiswaldense]|nr:MAG: HNH endonuclease [Candidatus Methanogranum sp. U3.2.1]
MKEIQRVPYSTEEDILVVELYSRTPYAKIHSDNPEIIDLARFLTDNGHPRTPTAIRFKMENLKSVDEKYLDNGRRKGMSNISSQLSDVWKRFHDSGFSDIDSEADKARKIIQEGLISDNNEKSYLSYDISIDGRIVERIAKVRVNQPLFRSRVMAAYNGRCCVTGLDVPIFLQACHIKPWKDCEGDLSSQRMDVRNGLCLNVLYHIAFDEGYMGIDEDRAVMYSPRFKEYYDKDFISRVFTPFEGKKIDINVRIPAGEFYLDYHRKNVFMDS